MTIIKLSTAEKKKYKVLSNNVAKGTTRIIEPFARFAYFTILCCNNGYNGDVILNFNNPVYAKLFELILIDPYYLTEYYEYIWSKQFSYGNDDYYNNIKNEFEESEIKKKAALLVYLLQKGNFNFIENKRTYGKSPNEMNNTIKLLSVLLKGRTVITNNKYSIFTEARVGDTFFVDTYDKHLKENLKNVVNRGASYIVYPSNDINKSKKELIKTLSETDAVEVYKETSVLFYKSKGV